MTPVIAVWRAPFRHHFASSTIDPMLALRPRIFRLLLLACLSVTMMACSGGKDDPAPAATRPEDTEMGTAAVIQPGPLTSYYFEASVKAATQINSTSYLVIKGWYEAPDRTRWDISSSNPADSQYVRQLYIVGEDQWLFEPGTNTYTVGKNAEAAAKFKDRPYPLNSNYQLGLVPTEAMANQQKVGSDTYLGRAVDIFEGTIGTIKTTNWIDVEYGFVLRQVVVSGDPNLVSFTAQVEKVLFNPRLDAQAFVFTPPAGAKNASATPLTTGIRATTGPLNIPPGLLSPSYIPEGYSLQSSSQTASGGVTSYIERKLANAGGATLLVSETYRPGGLPEQFKVGTVVRVRGVDGYTSRGGGLTTLLFYDAEIIVVLQSTALDVTELRRIAESMELAK